MSHTLIDTHCHINFDHFDADRDAVLQRASNVGVTRLIIPAVDIETSEQALALSQTHNGIYGAVGVHPNSSADFTTETLETLRRLSQQPKVIAIGEIGLDYHWDFSPPDKQKRAFKAQLDLACEMELPVIIHDREAHEDVMGMLEEWAKTLPPKLQGRAGVLHSFSASLEIAQRALAIGFYLGFTGPITYKKAESLRIVAQHIPLDRMLVETDAPYLTPEPYRGKRNSPEYIPDIVDRIASVRTTSIENIAQATTENAERLFLL